MQRTGTEVCEAATAECRALVATGPAPEGHPDNTTLHRSAPFLAQLIAIRVGLPQTRERRRAEPDEAVHAYAAVGAPRVPHAGSTLSRAL